MENKNIVKQLKNLYKIIDNLQNIEVKINDEEKTLLSLRSLPKSFGTLRTLSLFQGRYYHFEWISDGVRFKKLSKMKYLMIEVDGEGFSVLRRRSESRGNHKERDPTQILSPSSKILLLKI